MVEIGNAQVSKLQSLPVTALHVSYFECIKIDTTHRKSELVISLQVQS